jgi:hypothetical protein
MVSSTHSVVIPPKSGRLLRTAARAGLLVLVALTLSLTATAKAEAQCMSAKDCLNAATWQHAVADNYAAEGNFFRGYATHYFALAYEWNQKATFAFHAGDANAAAWYKAIADDYSRKSVQNANAADQRFAQAASMRAAAEDSLNRGKFFAALSDADPANPEGIEVASANPGGGYNCTNAQKQVKNQRKIESSWAKSDLFSYRIETPWTFCNGQITRIFPAVPWETIHDAGDDANWKFVSRDKKRANCYGGTPERCAWTYQWHFWLDLPTVKIGDFEIDVDKHKYPCVTTQVRGDGAHYRHGGCDLKAWSGPQWGGKET